MVGAIAFNTASIFWNRKDHRRWRFPLRPSLERAEVALCSSRSLTAARGRAAIRNLRFSPKRPAFKPLSRWYDRCCREKARMEMRVGSLMLLAVAVAACSAEKLDHASKVAAQPDASVGTVTFHIAVPTTQSFCDQIGPCEGGISHVLVSNSAGQSLDLTVPFFCGSSCPGSGQCMQTCLSIPCTGPGEGVAVKSGDQQWSGLYYGPSVCGADCFVPSYAPAGQYVAQFCAIPGTLSSSDAGPPACMTTGSAVCGPSVPFTFPSATPVDLTLSAGLDGD
jgi:hypothetical protein